LPKTQILKFISTVYLDRIKNDFNKVNPIYAIAYDNLLQKYGLKKVAESKLQTILESVYGYLDNYRIKTFARLMKLIEPL
jgi:hypothetical protein